MTYRHKLSRRLAICRYPVRFFLMIAPLLFLLACAPGELKEGFEPSGPASVDDVTEVTITPEKPSLGTDEMVRIRVRGRTDNGDEMTPPMDWTADGGTITQTSNYEAYFSSTSAGSFKVVGRGRNKNKPADTTTVVVIEPTYSIVSIAVSPDPTSVISGLSQTFTATGLRSDGSSASPSVSWAATGGTITSGGVFTAGSIEGGSVVTALTTDGLTDTSAVTVLPAPDGGPNEPAGFVVLTDRPFSAQFEDGWNMNATSYFSVAQDASAPKSASSFGRAVYPAGFAGGSAPVTAWRSINQRSSTQIYVSFWVRFSDNFVGHPSSSVNKIFHVWIGGSNRVVLAAYGGYSDPFVPQIRLQNMNSGGSFNLSPNVDASKLMVRGRWYLWETVLVANTPGSSDGRIDWWLDGTKVGSRTGLNFVNATTSNKWESLTWSPTWGGVGDVVPADQWIGLDHVHVSGN